MHASKPKAGILAGVLACLSLPSLAQQTREYWIAADEVAWDYAPSYPTNLMSGQPFTPEQDLFFSYGIGRVYTKAQYRQYTANWAALVQRTPQEQANLGILGPIIRAEVGDSIIVHFKNNTRFAQSVHPHGVFYDKTAEGAPYEDGTAGSDKADDMVPPGGTHDYVWGVPRRAGPGPRDPSSIAWLYHGHVDEAADTNSGLIGVMIITRRGQANPDGSPRGIDREFVSLFMVMNENTSRYFPVNLATCTGFCDPLDPLFEESNLMHSINGLMWGNNEYFMNYGEKVRWHVVSLGTEVDLHTPHWHGTTLLEYGRRVDVTELLPASAKTLDMRCDNRGTWMYHCHVDDHLNAGMMTKYTIL